MCLRAGSCVWPSLVQLLWVSAELFPYVSERPGWGHFQRCIGRKTTEGFWERFIFLRDLRKYNLCSVFFFFLRQCVCVLKLQTLSTSSPFMLGGRWAWFLPIMNSDWGKITVIQCLQNSFTHQQSDKHPHPPRVNKKKILSVTWCSTLVFRCASEVQRVKVKRRIQWNMHKPVNNINTLTLETLPQQHEAGHTLSARAYLKKRNTEVW